MNRTTLLRILMGMGVGLLLASTAAGQWYIPPAIDYQGKLADSAGNPINGTLSIKFSIYHNNIVKTSLWSETHSTVQVTDGLFHVPLGTASTIPYDLFSTYPRWLGITVGADQEMTPRKQLLSVPYAYTARTDYDWDRSGDTLYTKFDVGIGTVSPDAPLDIEQNGAFTVLLKSINNDPNIRLTGQSGNAVVEFYEGASYRGAFGYNLSQDYLFLYEGGNVVVQNGKLGVNTNAPAETLHVNGSSKFGSGGTPFLEIVEMTGTTSSTATFIRRALPPGYTEENTRCLSAELWNGTRQSWVDSGYEDGSDYFNSGITRGNSGASDSLYLDYSTVHMNQPYRAILMKMK